MGYSFAEPQVTEVRAITGGSVGAIARLNTALQE